MGGKTSQSTNQVTIPPEVLARYNSVNATAEKAAAQPFQQYSTDPSAFVAQLNAQQQAGQSGINQYANAAQPGYQAGYGATNAAMQAIQGGQNVAQPYFQGAQTIAAGILPQYQQAAGLAGAAMTPLQQATYAAQPSYQTAQAGTMGAANQLGGISQGYNAPNYQQGVQGYMNPYLQNAMGSTAAMLQNQNQQQQQQLQGNAISQGAFGGDRGNIAQAALMGQQNLAMGQTLGQMANQGYQAAAQNYMSGLGQQANIATQQGALANQYGQLGGQAQQALINAGLAQSQGAGNIANIAGQGMAGANQYGALGTAAQNAALQGVPLSLAAGQQYGALGAGAQAAGLAGAQAQIGAGTLGQQTQQAGLSALYNQFQQQQAYPFQLAQFLANIAEGTGALSGSTTTTTQPMGLFGNLSDERAKENIEPIGKTFDGQNIYKFNYKGEPNAQVGLIAQDVEKRNPDAVHEQGGLKYVDYDKATSNAAHRGHFYYGGIAREHHDGSEGNVVGGSDQMQAALAAQQDAFAPFAGKGIYGHAAGSLPGGGKGIVPTGSVPVHQLMMANAAHQQNDNTLQEAAGLARSGKELYGDYKGLKEMVSPTPTDLSQYPLAEAGTPMPIARPEDLYRGGIARLHRESGGDTPYSSDDPMEKVVQSGEKSPAELKLAQASPTTPPGGGGLGDIAALMKVGQTAAEAIPAVMAMFAARGGVIGREHHDGSEGNVVGDDGGLDSKLQYKIAPQNLADMDPVQQQVVKGIYGGESGGQYDVLNGGEKFDPSQGHPHRVGKGGESTAAGAGQFIGETWDRVTGGAPMTPAYQDAATWKLAQDDYQRRTGRDLKADVADQGFSPEIKAALAPTWTSLGEGKPSRQVAQQTPPTGIAGGQTNQPSLWDKLSSEDVILPILSGLGTMASSNSRYLLPALLQGIGGGAQTYMQLQKQQSEIAKNTMGLAASRFTPIGNGQYFDKIQGDTVGMGEYQRRLASMPGMSKYMGAIGAQQPTAGGIAAPSAEAPAAAPAGIAAPKATPAAAPADQAAAQATETAKAVTTPQAAPAAAAPAGISDAVTGALADAEKNPQVAALRSQATNWQGQIADIENKYQAAAAQSYIPAQKVLADKYQQQLQYAREMAKDFTTRADARAQLIAQPAIETAKSTATTEASKQAELKYAPQIKQAELQAGVVTPELYKTNITFRTQANKDAVEANNALNQSQQMMNLMFDPQTKEAVINGGPLGETLANSAAVLKQAGFSDGFIKMFTGTDPNNAQALEKLRTALGSEIARQDLGPGNQVRQQEFLRFLQSTPGVQMLPEAFKFINENMIQPKAKLAQDAYESIYKLDPTKEDLQGAYYDYQKAHPWYHPQATAPAQGIAQPAAAQQVSPDVRAAAQAELARRRAAQGVQ